MGPLTSFLEHLLQKCSATSVMDKSPSKVSLQFQDWEKSLGKYLEMISLKYNHPGRSNSSWVMVGA